MAKYRPSDDGKTIDGRTVVFLSRTGPDDSAPPGIAREKRDEAARLETAKSQAATLQAAARSGVPFCEECEKARKKLAEAKARP